ncbi:hybrid sensor histidine kinase/response regulator [Parvularcula oceani]|uniref:hybrid sensor histidine kinase/response regulator n=1 Tax=Parvularcula oceani TaxID=1247963 RepID=UPI00068FD352|nr:hybrid sensor histidine kinase/response regulator [Parvularcula oceani]
MSDRITRLRGALRGLTNGLFVRLVLTILLVLTTLTVGLSLVSAFRVTKAADEQAYDEAVATADLAAVALESAITEGSLSAVSAVISAVQGRDEVCEATIHLQHGEEYGTPSGYLDDAEQKALAAVLAGANRTVAETWDGLVVIEPLEAPDGSTVGALVVRTRTIDFWQSAWSALQRNMIGGLPIALLAFFGAYLVARSITKPLEQLSRAAGRIAEDDFDITFPANGSEETQRLSQTLSRMVRSLQVARLKAERAAKLAKDASRAKSDFLANMSHEIRTPMNGVIGVAEILLETDLDEKQRELAKIMLSSGSALVTIINDILDFSKIEAGKMTIAPEPFDLRSSVQDVMTLMATRAQEKDVELIVEYQSDLPQAFIGDGGRIRQIVTNLVGNAVKFTDRGHVAARVTGTVKNRVAAVRIEVEDTGIGIPAGLQERMFEKFEQADNTSTRRYQGTGIGLSISRSLTELMGGRIGVRSQVGKGSCFTVELPLPVDPDAAASITDQALPALRGLAVLVVDDNSYNRRIVADHTRRWGMRVTAAGGAEEASRAFAESGPFDLVITDFNMPHTDGIEMMDLLTERHGYEGPAIMLSSLSHRGEANKAAGRRFSAWLTKPVRASQLMDAVASALYRESIRKAQATTSAVAAADQPRYDIIVAEDNVVNQMVIKTMLAGLGAEVRLANTGLEALEAYRQQKPDLILMDVSMPEMDGLEATRELRKIEGGSGASPCPVIAATAHVMDEDRAACLAAGMDGIVNKPIKKDALKGVLATWLGEDGPEQDGAAEAG